MKRYLIFALLGPFIGGFLLLLVTTSLSGYWTQTNVAEVTKLFVVFIKTLQFSYLFGIIPVLMFAAVDDIIYHVRGISPALRTAIVAMVAFFATGFLYGSRGGDSGIIQFMLYGTVGLVPAIISSWLSRDPKPAS